jgi:hypothetical protein
MTAAYLQLSSDVNFDAAKLSSFATDCDVARPGHLVGWNPVLCLHGLAIDERRPKLSRWVAETTRSISARETWC